MSEPNRPTREECEALAKHVVDDMSYRKIIPRLAAEVIRLLDENAAALRTIEALSDSPTVKALTESIADAKAGRVKSLDCVDGGCEKYKLEEQLRHSREVSKALLAALQTILRYRLEDDCEICDCGKDCSQCVARAAIALAERPDALRPAEVSTEGESGFQGTGQ